MIRIQPCLRPTFICALLFPLAAAPVHAMQCAPDDAYEDNDSCAAAHPLGAGVYPGLRAGKSDPDFYSVTVPAGETGRVKVVHDYWAGDLDVFVYRRDACGGGPATAVGSSFSAQNNETVFWENPDADAAGDYLVEVRFYRWFHQTTCNTYALTLEGVVPGPAGPGAQGPPEAYQVDKIGAPSFTAHGPFPGKGNTWQLRDDLFLRGLDARLSFQGSAAIDVDVYVGSSEFSDYDRVFHRTDTLSGHGEDWYVFDDLCVPLVKDSFVLITLCSPDAPSHRYTIAWDEPREFGTFLHAYAQGNYPMPDTVDNSTNDGACYYRRIYTAPAVRAFCDAAPNSSGTAAGLRTWGSTSISANDLELELSDAPANSNGLFFFGAGSKNVPFGGSTLCVAGPVFRLPIVTTDSGGSARIPVDLTSLPSGLGSPSVGSIWTFQSWFRDPLAVGPPFNLSNALMVTFCD